MAKRAPAPILIAPINNAPRGVQGPTMNTSLEAGSWPIIKWPAVDIHRIEFLHFDSALARVGYGEPPDAAGASCWGGMTADGMVGLSWQWAQIAPQVFVLTDPMAVDSNLLLLASDGGQLSPLATTLVLNRIVARLPWQAEAARVHRRRGQRRIDTMQTVAPALPA
jgi:hypothetical protein